MQTTAVLPEGLTVRAPEVGDAEAIFGLVSAYNTGLVGLPDCTLAQVGEGIADPGFDCAADGWLVIAEDGAPVGYGTTFGRVGRQSIEIQLTSTVPGVAAWLFDRTMLRADEMGREAGHAEITVDTFVYRDDESLRALLSEHAFTTGTTYHRMRVDHTGPVEAPEVPDGVVVRRGAPDAATQWVAHELIIDTFRGQYGFSPRPHDEWVEMRDASSSWSQLTLLEIDGRAVAVRDCSDDFLGENCGHVGMLGVLEEFRGRGLAKFLLRDAFALDAAAGRDGTILLVDTNNPTPALDLYLSVGFTPTLVFEGWQRTLPVS
ncbi:GNAT family N-acetyltransferase [Kribbella sp. VKM Ac-2568]|uniref:GNAT family N-acetyltransferase n=1 Tax=Kribbella sp. VKM Ac-2568 TaxID=2512219 RepID=UPI00104368EF|nr:GNAT family N-acetyltransferase [Kribbella sp. VKM Ac-2568]TCM47714.1 ribosomal protein S18 acetylase RimI-like enzyme [Kribbella sp. VKM Ac-2568]